MGSKRGWTIAFVAAVLVLTVFGTGCDDGAEEAGSEPTTEIEPRERLIEVAHDLGGNGDHLVAVDLETFFDGNDDEASIAPNLDGHPGPQAIYEVLQALRDRPDVSAVVVLVRLEYDEYPAGEWPVGEAIHVVTSAPLAEIDRMTAAIDTDLAFEGLWDDALAVPAVPEGERVVTVWWD